MNETIENLVRLQELEFGETRSKTPTSQLIELRSLIPQPILAHYDRFAARGKKGLAAVRNQVCSGCHMRLPIGTVNTLLQGHDLQLCDTCGRYIYLPRPSEGQVPEVVLATKSSTQAAQRASDRPAT